MGKNKKPTEKINTPKKRYLKIQDFFIRTFNWPKQLLNYPNEKIKFKLDFNLTFENNLMRLKKKFHLTEEEIKNLTNHKLEFDILRLEKTKYLNKKRISEIYQAVFTEKHLNFFINTSEYILNHIENIDKNFKIYDEKKNFVYHHHRALINLLLGILFEYVCKALLISEDYKINEYEEGEYPTRKTENEVKFNPTRTFSVEVIWEFIKKKKIVKIPKNEEMIGNYLCFLRNFHAHIPLPPASRGNYNNLSIKLMKKILKEIKTKQFQKS